MQQTMVSIQEEEPELEYKTPNNVIISISLDLIVDLLILNPLYNAHFQGVTWVKNEETRYKHIASFGIANHHRVSLNRNAYRLWDILNYNYLANSKSTYSI
jgi:hypothetical protein